MHRLIISDTGPLIIFAKSARLNILVEQASEILITASVERECMAGNLQGSGEIRKILDQKIIKVKDDVPVPDSIAKTLLDQGEKSAISLAMNLNTPFVWLLMDESRGRKVAIQNKLQVIGSIGMLLSAQKLGIVTKIGPILDDWQKLGYWISDSLRQKALAIEKAGIERQRRL